jgi:DNA-binding transcriptional ArsR family regulator
MPSSEPNYRGIHLDAIAIKVLAHPLRSRLLSRLRTGGPATATELADVLHTNTGATSYHLRRLESVGLVLDTGEGEGRRRLWRAATDFHEWRNSEFRDDEDAATAAGWLERDYLRQFTARAESWYDVANEWPDVWLDALGLSDTFVTVTPAQLQELRDTLTTLVRQYRHRGDDDPAARRVYLFTFAAPFEADRPPTP